MTQVLAVLEYFGFAMEQGVHFFLVSNCSRMDTLLSHLDCSLIPFFPFNPVLMNYKLFHKAYRSHRVTQKEKLKGRRNQHTMWFYHVTGRFTFSYSFTSWYAVLELSMLLDFAQLSPRVSCLSEAFMTKVIFLFSFSLQIVLTS